MLPISFNSNKGLLEVLQISFNSNKGLLEVLPISFNSNKGLLEVLQIMFHDNFSINSLTCETGEENLEIWLFFHNPAILLFLEDFLEKNSIRFY